MALIKYKELAEKTSEKEGEGRAEKKDSTRKPKKSAKYYSIDNGRR